MVLGTTSLRHDAGARDKHLPLVQEVCDKVENMDGHSKYAKTFEVGDRSVCIVLRKREWVGLMQMCKVPKGLSAEAAKQVR
jgi:hypothetical protein